MPAGGPPFDKETAIARPSIARSTASMSAWTLVSRITGFARTWAMAYALGVTAIADSYDIANNLPNMLFELLAGGVLSSIFIPLYMERMQKHGERDAWEFASYVLNIILLLLGAVALIATVWPEPFVRSQTLTVSPERAELAVWFFRFFAVQIVFYGMGLVFTGVLNSYRHFLAPTVGPIFNNVVVTLTLLGFYVPLRHSNPKLAFTALAVGTTLGVVSMALVQVPALIKHKVRYTPRIDWRHPGLRKVGAKMVPTLLYVLTNLVTVSFRTNFAVATGEGGQAALRYAWQFQQLPYGVLAVALATAIFPELSERANANDTPGFVAMFARGLRATAVLIVPFAALLVVLARPVITLYRAGRFTAEDVPVVASVLAWWALGLFFYSAYLYVLRTFYALQDAKTPMYTNAATSVVQVALYAVLTAGVGGFGGLGIVGIPIADDVFFVIHLVLLLWILRRRVGPLEGRSITATFTKAAVASCGGAAAAWAALRLTSGLADLAAGFLLQLLVAGTVGLVVSYGLMVALRVRELAGLLARVRAGARRSGGNA